jgi:hypothetical protein
MAIHDSQLMTWLSHDEVAVRNVALDLLSEGFCTDPTLLVKVFEGWDRFGAALAFPGFPLLSFLEIPPELVEESLERAGAMSVGRKPIDRECRCAGKLIESLATCRAEIFEPFLNAIETLQISSKVFFRVSPIALRERCAVRHRSSSSLEIDLEDHDEAVVLTALECLFLRGEAAKIVEESLASLLNGEAPTMVSSFVLSLGQRYPLTDREATLVSLLDHKSSSVADSAAIGLARLREPKTQSLLAERFAGLSKFGQLRATEIVRRGRLPKSSELLRYLIPYGIDFAVQDAIRVAEVLLFDFYSLENWLEAFLLMDDQSLKRIKPMLSLVEPLGQELVPAEMPRVRKLMKSRLE